MCGDVTYTSTAEAQHLDYCYCTMCQQTSGSPFMAFIGVAKDTLNWKGILTGYRSSDMAMRLFCSKCGSALGMQYDCYPGKTHVAAGTIKQMKCAPPTLAMHLFVRSKPVWYRIPDDGVARHDAFDQSFMDVLNSYKA